MSLNVSPSQNIFIGLPIGRSYLATKHKLIMRKLFGFCKNNRHVHDMVRTANEATKMRIASNTADSLR